MYDLLATHTLPDDHLVVPLTTHGAGVLTAPQEVEGAAVTRAVRAPGRQLHAAHPVLLHIALQTHDRFTAVRTGRRYSTTQTLGLKGG